MTGGVGQNRPLSCSSSTPTTFRSTTETRESPGLHSPESIPHPINRLPEDIFVLIPRFFANGKGECEPFPTNKPLITMTHVCRSWRDVLLSAPALWTQLNFSTSKSKQAEGFLGRSGNQLLDVYQSLENDEHVDPFLSVTLANTYRLRWLELFSSQHLDRVLAQFTSPAPELEHLEIENDTDVTARDVKLPSTVFGGWLPKLASLSLHYLRTDLRDFNFPSLTRFSFSTGTTTSVRDLTSFFERCPSLEFIQLCLCYMPQPPAAPPHKRVRLAALKELRLNHTASFSGVLDHLALPKCTEMMLKGEFVDEKFARNPYPIARFHPSSIDHIPVTREIAKAVAIPNSCILSGPNGNLRFWCFEKTRGIFDAAFFTSFSPISVLGIRELWVGQNAMSRTGTSHTFWEQVDIDDAFRVLTKVEDLTIVGCKTEPFFWTLGVATGNSVLLPHLRRLTVFTGRRDLDVPGLIQCAKARNLGRYRPLEEVTLVFEKEPGSGLVHGVELLRDFVGKLICRIGKAPRLFWLDRDCDEW